MVFPVVMYECESWTIKKAESRRIDAFASGAADDSWTARRSNQSTLKEINPDYSLGGLMLKLELQYFGPLMPRAGSPERRLCWERTRAGEEGNHRGWDDQMASSTLWTWIWANSEIVKDRESWHATVHGVTKNWTWLSYWTTTTYIMILTHFSPHLFFFKFYS